MRMSEFHQTAGVPYNYWSVGELMPRREIKKLQLARLQEQVNYIWANSNFYHKKWQESGFSPDKLGSLDDMRLIPLLSKEEIRVSQVEDPPYGMMRIPGRGPVNRVAMTSGTTGDPVLIPFTAEDYFGGFCEGAARFLWAAGVNKNDVVHVAFGFMPFIGLGGVYDACEHLIGSLVVPGGTWSSVVRLKMLQKFKVTVLVGTPTYLLHMAAVAAEEGIDASKLGLRLVMTTGEMGSSSVPNTGVRLEKSYGCKIHDFSGTQECNYISWTCDEGTSHLNEDLVYCEVLDPKTYEPVEPGESGVMVVSDLVQKTHPMIRYKTGDCIRGIDEDYHCACGRTLSRFKGYIGRVDDVIKVKGVSVSVTGVENVLRGIDGCSDSYEYVAVRDGEKDKIIVRLEPAKNIDPLNWGDLRSQVSETLKRSFMISMDVEILPPGTLPVFALKSKRFKDCRNSEIPPDLTE
jgi:phenylacetate-CoA ligase